MSDHPAAPVPGSHDERKTVELCRITDPAVLPVIKSLLAASGIDFMVQGEEVMGLLPLGTFGGGGKHHFMTTVIRVLEEQEEAARELLATATELEDGAEFGAAEEGAEAPADAEDGAA